MVALAAQAVPQDNGAEAVVGEKRHEVGAFAADFQRSVAAARRQDHDSACVQRAIAG